jgi:Flp pilus assembly protein TadD
MSSRSQREAVNIVLLRAISRRAFGEAHPQTVKVLSGLGVAYLRLRRLAEAELCFRDAVAAQQRLSGELARDTLKSKANLAGVLYLRGKFGEAEKAFTQRTSNNARSSGLTIETRYALFTMLQQPSTYSVSGRLPRSATAA